MTGPGRPRTGTPILVRIPEDLLERVDQMAADYVLSRAEAIRRVLDANVPQKRP